MAQECCVRPFRPSLNSSFSFSPATGPGPCPLCLVCECRSSQDVAMFCLLHFNGFIFPAKLEKLLLRAVRVALGSGLKLGANWCCPVFVHSLLGFVVTFSLLIMVGPLALTESTPLNCNFWQHFGLHKSWLVCSGSKSRLRRSLVSLSLTLAHASSL